jgi:hypothetical protein
MTCRECSRPDALLRIRFAGRSDQDRGHYPATPGSLVYAAARAKWQRARAPDPTMACEWHRQGLQQMMCT